jgi:5-methylcytosine-specific restriction protein A
MARREFSKKVKLAAWERCGGYCENKECGIKILTGNGPEYDHILEAFLGGEPTVENCRVLCLRCHKAKTGSRRREIDKTRRLAEKQIKARTKRQGFRGWRRMNGDVVWR